MAEKDRIQSEQAQIGPDEAVQADTEAAETPVPKEFLDRRQAAMRDRREPQFPPLVETTETATAESLPNEPETDCEPPPGDTSR